MKPKITSSGLLNEMNINLASDKTISSMTEGSLPTPDKLRFTDLYLRDSQGKQLPDSAVKTNIIRSDNEPFRKITFHISILSYQGFFKDFAICISYRDANCSLAEKFYPIDEMLSVIASLPLQDILDLTQVCISVRSKQGTPLKISMSVDGLAAAEELKIDVTALSDITLFIDDHSKEKDETQKPIGWISFNTPNIFY